ncbi:HsdM family class I SAM-dependent methyltransferase [Streptomyces beigongshangae]|uniref:HsdM family class I SAM-dependent methyltransferase n=1 Tax=Streptomyces beigongshangae TaxID=2841597 RepID=UPI0021A61A90|nr:SAM-dependent methyltransferase [Streptomyces sp. REN17]
MTAGAETVDPLAFRGVWRAIDALCEVVASEDAYQAAFQVSWLRSAGGGLWSVLNRHGGSAVQALSAAWARGQLDSRFSLGVRGSIGAVGLFPEADRRLAALITEVDGAGPAGGLFDACLDRYSAKLGEGGDYFTPRDMARLMAGLAGPRAGERVLDPVCGSGRLLVEAVQWARRRKPGEGVPLLYGRDSSTGARRVAAMNLVLNSLQGDLGAGSVDSLRGGSIGLAADVVLANPPFRMSGWGHDELVGDPRWSFGQPPRSSANFAWVQHILSELAPRGRAVVLLASGAGKSTRGDERQIRQRMVESDVLAGVVALPAGLFPHTRFGASLWLLSKDKTAHTGWGRKSRLGEVLFMDARRLATRAGRSRRHLADGEVTRICRLFEAWRGADDAGAGAMSDDLMGEVSWCRSVRHEVIEAAGYDLTPGRYAGPSPAATDISPGHEVAGQSPKEELYRCFGEVARIDERLRSVLRGT